MLFCCLKPKNIFNGCSSQIHCIVIDFFHNKIYCLPQSYYLKTFSYTTSVTTNHRTSSRSLSFPECRLHEATNLAVFSITIYVMSRKMPVIWLVLHTYVCENQILCIFHLGDRMNTDIVTLMDRDCERDSDDESLN